MILDKKVVVKVQGKDRWGNRLGVILIEGKTDPRFELLEAGLAWTAEKDPIEELESVKEKAKEKGKGLWKKKDPTPPWTFRREQTMLQPKYR
jgi:endonuclease YncB( thermonuclease family)